MRMRASPLCTAATILFLFQRATAAPIVSLSATANPTTVGIGQTITIAVELTGLGAGQQLDSLAATVVYDGSLLGVPSVTKGPIVPNPLDDPLDLLISTDTGLADVAFLTFSVDPADHIMSNGTFFTLDATALTQGNTSIALDFVSATLFNAANPNDPTLITIESGAPLSFVVVPEPTNLLSICVLVLAIGLTLRGSNRNRGLTQKR